MVLLNNSTRQTYIHANYHGQHRDDDARGVARQSRFLTQSVMEARSDDYSGEAGGHSGTAGGNGVISILQFFPRNN